MSKFRYASPINFALLCYVCSPSYLIPMHYILFNTLSRIIHDWLNVEFISGIFKVGHFKQEFSKNSKHWMKNDSYFLSSGVCCLIGDKKGALLSAWQLVASIKLDFYTLSNIFKKIMEKLLENYDQLTQIFD